MARTPDFAPMTSMMALEASSRLTKSTLPQLQEVQKRLIDYMTLLEQYYFPVVKEDDGYVFDDDSGGRMLQLLLKHSTFLDKLSLFVAAVEQNLVPKDYITAFERSVLAAIVSPRAIANDRMMLISWQYAEEFRNFLKGFEGDSEEDELQSALFSMGMTKRGSQPEEGKLVKPIISTDIGYKYGALTVNLNTVMGFGYFVGMMLAIAKAMVDNPHGARGLTNLCLLPNYLGEEVFNYDFKRVDAYINRVITEVLGSSVNARTPYQGENLVTVTKTVLESTWASDIGKITGDALIIYGHAMHHDAQTDGFSFDLVTDILATGMSMVEDQIAQLTKTTPVAKTDSIDKLEGFVAEAQKSLEVAKIEAADEEQGVIEGVVDVIIKSGKLPKYTAEQKAKYDMPMDETIRSRPWYVAQIHKLASALKLGPDEAEKAIAMASYETTDRVTRNTRAATVAAYKQSVQDKIDEGKFSEQPWYMDTVAAVAEGLGGDLHKANQVLSRAYAKAEGKLDEIFENADVKALIALAKEYDEKTAAASTKKAAAKA